MELVDDMLFVVFSNGMGIVSVADPEHPVITSIFQFEEQYDDRYRLEGIAVMGDLMFTPGNIPFGEEDSWVQGLSIWDKSDLNNIQYVGECGLRVACAQQIAIYNNYVYITSNFGVDGLSVVDVSDAANPREVLYMDDIIYATNVKVFGDLLFVLEICYGVKIFSLENPARPELIGQYDTPSLLMDIDVDLAEGYMYLGEYDDISIYDIARFTGVWDVEVSEDNHDYGEVEIDSTIEWELTLSNQGNNPVRVDNIVIDNDVFSAEFLNFNEINPDEQASIQIQFTPTEVAGYSGIITIHTDLRDIEVNLSGTGVNINDINDSADNAPLNFAITSISPNPFNPSIAITYTLPVAEQVKLSVYDLVGREVARLVDGYQSAGEHNISWNAENQPTGFYIARLSTPLGNRDVKLLLMK